MPSNEKSASSLARELLEQVIGPLPAIDIHTHISPSQPAAQNLKEIVLYHYIITELETAGFNPKKFQEAGSADELAGLLLSAERSLGNTVTFWCLQRVLETYVPQGGLDTRKLLAVDEKIRKTAADPAWPRTVLRDKNNIRKTFLTLSVLETLPPFDAELFAGTLRMDELATGFSPANLRKLESLVGADIGSLTALERAVATRVRDFAAGGGRAITIGVAPEEDFVLPDRAAADKLWERSAAGEDLPPGERASLHSYLLDMFAGLAQEFRLPFQILLGVRRPLAGETAAPVVYPGLATRYAPVFHRFRQVPFALMLSSVAHSQELIALARNYPNVCVSGHWWFAFSPPYIRAMLTERLLLLPAVKLHGFFSDAYNVEWTSGKIALLKKELAWVLADLIVSDYLSERQAPEIARALLYENPARFYRIEASA